MSFARLAFSSDRPRRLSDLRPGASGTIAEVEPFRADRVARLLALGVTPGASIRVLQTMPGIVFLCDQTELAVERDVAHNIFITLLEG